MGSINQIYFEQTGVWDIQHRNSPAEQQRLEETIHRIPHDVESILDVGCGSGFLVNACLNQKQRRFSRIVGIDTSVKALEAVQTEKKQGSITDIPFGNREFDMVTCLEVLEHITVDDFNKALTEILRVANKYILVTVPNSELLYYKLVVCPKCYCCFNPWHHVRSFNISDMQRLFSTFRVLECVPIGPYLETIFSHPMIVGVNLLYIRQQLPINSICPQCHYKQTESIYTEEKKKNKVFKTVTKGLTYIAKRTVLNKKRKQKWLLALYQKTV